MIGAVADWYDFFIYGTASALVLGRLFFPGSLAQGTLAAFATFAVGFLFRPIGSVVFGHFGDRIGRKRMLALTLVIMGGSSTLIGLLPTHNQIGIAAPVLLVVLRALQGFAVGGEWGGATLLAIESAPNGKRATRSSVVQSGAFVGLLLANAMYLILSAVLPSDSFDAWGWRIPFLVSAVILGIGYWIRRGVPETPEFEAVKKQGLIKKVPLIAALKKHPIAVLTIIGMYLGPNVVTYIVLTFSIPFAKAQAGVSSTVLLTASLVAAGGSLITIPLAAKWGDRKGYLRVYLTGAMITVVFAFPFIWALSSGNAVNIVLAAVVMLVIGAAPMVAVQQPIFTDLFDAEFRYSGAGFSYGLGAAIGGMSPFVATALSQADGGKGMYPTLYLIGMVMISVVTGVLVRREIHRNHISGGLTEPTNVHPSAAVGDAVPHTTD
ncbi:hypothetical protein BMF89_16700 [Arthrobacter sp. SRS-W-1-2016]|uniref:MFS transporter n=1 Tax=Arthrobacter sp. SRS-W-1-2016 TaxID=1930254 RepID=UPI0009CA91DF|nr:MFS transporter [Arthrobacter sp. SRS-W-1-2016]OOP60505.1 hypothetical protein BMF89_16700 [Arthrobacter sp. SRS-W-1-2016]